MNTWIGENFNATGRQVLGIVRDPVQNQVRACDPVQMSIQCKNCNHTWNPALRPMTLAVSEELAMKGQSVTCPECSHTGAIHPSFR